MPISAGRQLGLATSLLVAFLVLSCQTPPKKPKRTRASDSALQTEKVVPAKPVPAVPIRPVYTKALWVDSWGPGLYDAAQCDAMIAWAKQSGINTLLIEVRKAGDAYHLSRLEPRGRRGEGGPRLDASFDPLAYVLDKARRGLGMRVEAWVVLNRVWLGTKNPPPSRPEHVVNARPDWLLQNRRGGVRDQKSERPTMYLDPADPEARHYLTRICAEIASHYKVDAIHLDYVRYPGPDWGFGKKSIAQYRRETGQSAWPSASNKTFIAWRAQNVTKLVSQIRRAIRARSPHMELTAATVLWGKAPKAGTGLRNSAIYRGALQDWGNWLKDGLVDAVYPMHYRRQDRDGSEFSAWLKTLASLPKGPGRLIVGQGAYLNAAHGTQQQLAAIRQQGLDGFAVFSYRTPSRHIAEKSAVASVIGAYK